MTQVTKKQKSSFGDWLKEVRTGKGIGVRELSVITDGECSASYISYLERNVYEGKDGSPTRPSESIVEALAAGLEVPINEARIAAGYTPLPSSTTARELLQAFQALFEGYGMLSEQGQSVARKQVDALIRGLMDMEGVQFSDSKGTRTRSIAEQEILHGPGLEAEEFSIDLSNPQPETKPSDEVEEFYFMTDEELKLSGFVDSKDKEDPE